MSQRSAGLETLANTPDVAFERAKREFAELHGSPKVEATRYFVAFLVSLVVIATLALVIVLMFPLKRNVPYIVEVRQGEGIVGRPVQAREYTPTDGMIKEAAAKFTANMWRLNSATTRDDLKLAQAMVRGTAVGQFNAFLSTEKPFDRLEKQPLLSRTIDGINVDSSKPGVAFIFFSTVERVGTSEPTRIQRRMTINYIIVPPESEEELYRNASGMTIVNIDYATEKR